MKYNNTSDVATFLEYMKNMGKRKLSMHCNPVLIHYGTLMFQNISEIHDMIYVSYLKDILVPDSIFYQRDGKVYSDEYSYYISAVIERYKVCL